MIHLEQGADSEHQRIRLILETMPGLVYTLAPTGELEFASQQLLNLFGTTLGELQNWAALAHPDDRERLVTKFNRSLATGEPMEDVHRSRRADGVYRWLHTQSRPLKRDGRIVRWFGLLMDIDELKRAEEQLRRSEAFLLEAQRLSHCGSWAHDPGTDKVTYSPEVLRVYDAQLHEDPSSREFYFKRIHPDDRQRVTDLFDEAQRKRTEFQADCRIVLPDGRLRYLLLRGHPLLNPNGELVEFLGTVVDATEQWQARKGLERAFEALRTTEARLSHAMQIATVGELAASIAHEVTQPLAAVVTNAHACRRWLSAQPPQLTPAREAAERIVRDGKGAGEVVLRIRSLFQRASVQRSLLNVNEVIGEVLRLIERELDRRKITVQTELDVRLPSVMGDRVQLQQVVLNLLKNSLESMDSVVDRSRTLFIRSRPQNDESALIEVRDRGIGMKEPEKAFEAFFTTKEGGMGVGLAISRSIVEAHEGRIWVAPGDGVGTTICFSLPFRSTGGAP